MEGGLRRFLGVYSACWALLLEELLSPHTETSDPSSTHLSKFPVDQKTWLFLPYGFSMQVSTDFVPVLLGGATYRGKNPAAYATAVPAPQLTRRCSSLWCHLTSGEKRRESDQVPPSPSP